MVILQFICSFKGHDFESPSFLRNSIEDIQKYSWLLPGWPVASCCVRQGWADTAACCLFAHIHQPANSPIICSHPLTACQLLKPLTLIPLRAGGIFPLISDGLGCRWGDGCAWGSHVLHPGRDAPVQQLTCFRLHPSHLPILFHPPLPRESETCHL